MDHSDADSSEEIATLVLRAQDGDLASFERLVDRFQGSLVRLTFRMLGNRADAEDVAQETLMNAWLKLEFLETPEAFPTWLYRQAVNRCKDMLRSPRRRATIPLDDEDAFLPLPDESAEGNPQRRAENRSSMDALSMLLQQLPEHLRECWVLREQMDMSYEQISKTLAIPTATVRGRLARARKTLAEEMKDWR